MNNKFDLTEEEKRLEDELDNYVSIKGEKREKIEKIIANAKKKKFLNLYNC